MDTTTLRTFVEVMKLGSFAAAARRREADPSVVSRAIALLEAELGVRLFQRTTRRLAPTEAGAAYFARVQPLLEELDRAFEEARDAQSTPAGSLRVTASVAYGQTALVPLLADWRRAYPGLALDLLLTDSVVDLVAERIDAALRLGPRSDSSMIGMELARTRYRVVASPAYLRRHGRPRDPAQLAERDCLRFALPGFRSAWRFRRDGGEPEEVPVHGTITLSSGLALRQAAIDGLGPALLADWLVGADLAAGRLVDLFPKLESTATDFDTAVWLLYPSRAYVPLKLRCFVDFVQRHLGRRAAAG